MLTPSWIVATVAAAPMPFGYILAMVLPSGAFLALLELLLLFSIWHIVAFPIMAFIGVLIGRLIYRGSSAEQVTTWQAKAAGTCSSAMKDGRTLSLYRELPASELLRDFTLNFCLGSGKAINLRDLTSSIESMTRLRKTKY
jgi:hypothetical protein